MQIEEALAALTQEPRGVLGIEQQGKSPAAFLVDARYLEELQEMVELRAGQKTSRSTTFPRKTRTVRETKGETQKRPSRKERKTRAAARIQAEQREHEAEKTSRRMKQAHDIRRKKMQRRGVQRHSSFSVGLR